MLKTKPARTRRLGASTLETGLLIGAVAIAAVVVVTAVGQEVERLLSSTGNLLLEANGAPDAEPANTNSAPVVSDVNLGQIDVIYDPVFFLSSFTLLAGASDPDGDDLSLVSVGNMVNGDLLPNGADFILVLLDGGYGSFQFEVSDGINPPVSATVSWEGYFSE